MTRAEYRKFMTHKNSSSCETSTIRHQYPFRFGRKKKILKRHSCVGGTLSITSFCSKVFTIAIKARLFSDVGGYNGTKGRRTYESQNLRCATFALKNKRQAITTKTPSHNRVGSTNRLPGTPQVSQLTTNRKARPRSTIR